MKIQIFFHTHLWKRQYSLKVPDMIHNINIIPPIFFKPTGIVVPKV